MKPVRSSATPRDWRDVLAFTVILLWGASLLVLVWLSIPAEFRSGVTASAIMSGVKKVVSGVNVIAAPIVAFYFGSALGRQSPVERRHVMFFMTLTIIVLAVCGLVIYRLRAIGAQDIAVSEGLEVFAWLSPNMTIPLGCLFAKAAAAPRENAK